MPTPETRVGSSLCFLRLWTQHSKKLFNRMVNRSIRLSQRCPLANGGFIQPCFAPIMVASDMLAIAITLLCINVLYGSIIIGNKCTSTI